jgi:hypothetical protein
MTVSPRKPTGIVSQQHAQAKRCPMTHRSGGLLLATAEAAAAPSCATHKAPPTCVAAAS